LPTLDGQLRLPGLGSPVSVERDALGIPTIRGASRRDVARATGFLHAQDRFPVLPGHNDPDALVRGGVLERVRQQIAHDLLDPSLVSLNPDGREHRHDATAPKLFGQAGETLFHGLGQVEWPQLEKDLARSHARNVEQIVHDTGQVSNLPLQDLAGRRRPRVRLVRQIEDRRRVRDGGQRIAQFMAEHGQEFVLGAAGSLRFGSRDLGNRQESNALPLGTLALFMLMAKTSVDVEMRSLQGMKLLNG
jgi:hypothetical protein